MWSTFLPELRNGRFFATRYKPCIFCKAYKPSTSPYKPCRSWFQTANLKFYKLSKLQQKPDSKLNVLVFLELIFPQMRFQYEYFTCSRERSDHPNLHPPTSSFHPPTSWHLIFCDQAASFLPSDLHPPTS